MPAASFAEIRISIFCDITIEKRQRRALPLFSKSGS
jgi:hypothetical protein